jgi:hypothetical protein
MYTVSKKAVILLFASKVVGLGVNAKKTFKCMFLSCQRTAGQCRRTKIAYTSFIHLWKFRYVGLALTSQNMPKEIRSRSDSSNAIIWPTTF